MTIAENLRTHRARLRLSQSDVAEFAGISLKAYASYESDPNKRINIDIVVKISCLFGIYPEWLIREQGKRFITLDVLKLDKNRVQEALSNLRIDAPSNKTKDIVHLLCSEHNYNLIWLVNGEGDIHILENFSVRLADIYDACSIRESAKELNISHTALSEYIKGNSVPPYSIVLQIAEQKKISLQWLISGIGRREDYRNQVFYLESLVSWLHTLSEYEQIDIKKAILIQFPEYDAWLKDNPELDVYPFFGRNNSQKVDN